MRRTIIILPPTADDDTLAPVGWRVVAHNVYLRTATSAHPSGWAHFDYVKMPDYRWGIFLSPQVADRKIHFGEELGKPVWQDVPGEHRANLRRIIVTQGDTEPASVEQQRQLGLTAPSLYDLRNLFQINVEEGRHLWAIVYLLHRFFGRDGREEADALLQRRSGQEDNPRILGAFNEATPDWLSFFMFTYFTDRDGKFQLLALAESSWTQLGELRSFSRARSFSGVALGRSWRACLPPITVFAGPRPPRNHRYMKFSLHSVRSTSITGGNVYGATPDYGVILDEEDSLIGITDCGGNGSIAGATGNGTLYRLKLDE